VDGDEDVEDDDHREARDGEEEPDHLHVYLQHGVHYRAALVPVQDRDLLSEELDNVHVVPPDCLDKGGVVVADVDVNPLVSTGDFYSANVPETGGLDERSVAELVSDVHVNTFPPQERLEHLVRGHLAGPHQS